jgi:hypothetical protein
MNNPHILLIKSILLIALFFITPKSIAQQRKWYLNPGGKIGYAFGSNGGFTFAGEISITSIENNGTNGFGIFFSSESRHSFSDITHFGIEVFPQPFYGMSIGPSFIKTSNDTKIGIGTTIFYGALLLPYYRYTYIPGSTGLHELGTFIKMICPLQKENLSLGG